MLWRLALCISNNETHGDKGYGAQNQFSMALAVEKQLRKLRCRSLGTRPLAPVQLVSSEVVAVGLHSASLRGRPVFPDHEVLAIAELGVPRVAHACPQS